MNFDSLTNSDGAVLIDIDLAARTGTIRFLLHVLGEGPIELSPLLASVFLRIIDDPRSRRYIRVGTDLEVGSLIVPSSCA
jgi:large subunit ribosomal protein L17e